MTADQIRVDAMGDAVGAIQRNRDRSTCDLSRQDGLGRFFLTVAGAIGALAASLSGALKERHSEVPWQAVIAMRDFLRDDSAADESALNEALDVTVPQLASSLLDLASDAARMRAESAQPDVELAGDDMELDRNGAVTLDDVRARRRDIDRIAAQYGASNVRIFGSVARGEAKSYSDIDFLVDMERGRSLFDLGGLEMDLQGLFGRPIDVAFPPQGAFRERISAEAVPL